MLLSGYWGVMSLTGNLTSRVVKPVILTILTITAAVLLSYRDGCLNGLACWGIYQDKRTDGVYWWKNWWGISTIPVVQSDHLRVELGLYQ